MRLTPEAALGLLDLSQGVPVPSLAVQLPDSPQST
jgi:hypothetical protein